VIFDVDIDREKWHLNTLAFLHLQVLSPNPGCQLTLQSLTTNHERARASI
jgi:hypothetical protein